MASTSLMQALRCATFGAAVLALASTLYAAEPVQTASGAVQGGTSPDGKVRIYKGIPFAAPPVGDLRWKPPQPAASWQGVRSATEFGARCMQGHIFADMVFRDNGPSEDCLYLNVWTPADSPSAKLPVMVWIYGGGFQGGAASEPRQDGEHLAHKGVVVVSMNYRLGIFGFFAHPELAAESPQHAAGNYGLMDQTAALKWVHENIAAFGGDPSNVTIFGESAGSMSVSAQMASPLAQGMFGRAAGESGAVFGYGNSSPTLQESEQNGAAFAKEIGAPSLKELRAIPAQKLLDASLAQKGYRFWPNIDGLFFTESPWNTYAAGRQARVPLLAGWNQDEQSDRTFFRNKPETLESYKSNLSSMKNPDVEGFMKYYPAANEQEMKTSAGQLAGDIFIAYSTWRWLEFQFPVAPSYRYHFEEAPPPPPGGNVYGAYHSSDIEYVFGTLDWKKLPWTAADYRLSEQMQTYWTNFAKTGDPNGGGMPEWPVYGAAKFEVMHLNASSKAEPDATRDRYLFLNKRVEDRIHAEAEPTHN